MPTAGKPNPTAPKSKTASQPGPAQQMERRRQIRGLLLLAAAVLLFTILRAGLHRVFPTGWWRLW